jgi:hypothetical protein
LIRLECPNCKKDSYTASVHAFRPCPYCGIKFSGKYGLEKRVNYRFEKKIPLILLNGKKYKALTLNISDNGIGVKLPEKIAIKKGDIINLIIGSSVVKAKVIWINYNSEIKSSSAGLRMVDKTLAMLSI